MPPEEMLLRDRHEMPNAHAAQGVVSAEVLQSTAERFSSTTAFTCRAASNGEVSRKTGMAARSGATSWFGVLARRG